MWTAVKGTKCCATCAHWRGVRQEKGNGFITGGPSERGKCGAGKSSSALPGPCAMGGRACNSYVKY